MHLVLGYITTVLIWLVFWIHLRVRRHPEESLPKYRLRSKRSRCCLWGCRGISTGFSAGWTDPG